MLSFLCARVYVVKRNTCSLQYSTTVVSSHVVQLTDKQIDAWYRYILARDISASAGALCQQRRFAHPPTDPHKRWRRSWSSHASSLHIIVSTAIILACRLCGGWVYIQCGWERGCGDGCSGRDPGWRGEATLHTRYASITIVGTSYTWYSTACTPRMPSKVLPVHKCRFLRRPFLWGGGGGGRGVHTSNPTLTLILLITLKSPKLNGRPRAATPKQFYYCITVLV